MFGTVLAGVIQAATVVVMARLVGPTDYGAYAICIAVMSLTVNFVNSASERALIVAREIEYRGLAFSAIVLAAAAALIGVLACLVINAVHLFHVRIELLAILLFGSLLNACGLPIRVHFRRNLQFAPITWSEIGGLAIGAGLIAILLARMGLGGFSLVLGAAAQNATTLAILLLAGRRFIPLDIVWSAVADLGRKVISVGRFSGLEVINGQIPNLFIGHFGPASLGLYNRAQTAVQLPLQLLTASILRVMVSRLSDGLDDKAGTVRTARWMIVLTGCLIAPVSGGIAGSAREFTGVLLGAQWTSAALLVPILAVISWGVLTASVVGIVSEVTGHFNRKSSLQLASSTVTAVAALALLPFGVFGVCLALAAGALVLVLLNLWLTGRALEVSFATVLFWLVPGLLGGALCLGFAWLVSGALATESAFLTLAVQIAGCGVISAAVIALTHRELLPLILAAGFPRRTIRPDVAPD